jgi:hypothetical protein
LPSASSVVPRLALHVDEARRNHQARRINDLAGLLRRQITDPDDAIAGDPDVARCGG